MQRKRIEKSTFPRRGKSQKNYNWKSYRGGGGTNRSRPEGMGRFAPRLVTSAGGAGRYGSQVALGGLALLRRGRFGAGGAARYGPQVAFAASAMEPPRLRKNKN